MIVFINLKSRKSSMISEELLVFVPVLVKSCLEIWELSSKNIVGPVWVLNHLLVIIIKSEFRVLWDKVLAVISNPVVE